MEDWGMFRYLLPALGGGFGVYFLITQAGKAPNRNSCNFGWGPLLLLFVGAAVLLFAVYSVALDNPPNDGLNDEAWLLPTLIIINPFMIGFSLDSWRRKITWTDKGMTVSRFLRKEITVAWSEVQSLKYNGWAQWWRLRFTNGKSIVFYDMMKGSKYLIEECRKRNIS